MEPNSWNNMGHSNRIFSVKFTDENTIISGGWDSNVYYIKFRFTFGMLELKNLLLIFMDPVFLEIL